MKVFIVSWMVVNDNADNYEMNTRVFADKVKALAFRNELIEQIKKDWQADIFNDTDIEYGFKGEDNALITIQDNGFIEIVVEEKEVE